MRTQIAKYEPEQLIDLIRDISEIRSSLSTNAFDPVPATERAQYKRKMRLLTGIEGLLDKCCINVKSRGYTFLVDAICIIIDLKTLDVCLVSDVYPYIADKYNVKNLDTIEHSIRNCIKDGYERYTDGRSDDDLPEIYRNKPTNKKFLLYIAKEVSKMI